MSTTRRNLLKAATTGAAIASAGASSVIACQSVKKLTLLHLTDTHAQLETHWEYMPGQARIIAQRESRSRAIDLPDRALSQDELLQRLYSDA